MTDATNYREHQVVTLPPWLQDNTAQSFVYVLALVKDAFVEAAKAAVKQRFATTCRDDALSAVGEMYQLERGFIGDSTTYRTLLRNAWDIWSRAGTEQSVLDALEGQALTNVEILENGDWNVDGHPEKWWRMWVIVRPTFLMSEGDDVAPAGTATPGAEQWRGLLSAVKKWKPAHEYAFVIVVLDGALWGDPADMRTWGDGDTTWGATTMRTEFS
jgi:hypothetical protein